MTLNSWLFCLQAPRVGCHPAPTQPCWCCSGALVLQDGWEPNLLSSVTSPCVWIYIVGKDRELLIKSCYRFKWTFNDIKKQNKGNIRFNIHFCFQLNLDFFSLPLCMFEIKWKKIKQVSLKISEFLKYLVLGLEIIWYDCWLSGFGVDSSVPSLRNVGRWLQSKILGVWSQLSRVSP